MNAQYRYKPALFFGLTFLVTWVCWFGAAYLSHQEGTEMTAGALMGLGLLGPLVACLALVFSSGNSALKKDFLNKMVNPGLIKPIYLPMVFLLVPVVIVLAILLSTLFGQSLDQLQLTAEFSIMDGRPLLSLLIPILAPTLEELGWSGYGIDSLRSRHNLFITSAIFGLAWALWHLPLFFIKGYYHYNILNENMIYAVNFFLSVIPLTFITNWLYFKNNRSIIVAIIFHVVVVMSSEIFMVTNQTKCLVTLIITLFTIDLLIRDKKFFFGKNSDEKNKGAGGKNILPLNGLSHS